MSETPIQPRLLIREHVIDGLFMKEVRPAVPGGLATPLLMVHGGLHGWWAWESWLGFFATAGWPCFAMSLRNHTGSYAVPEEAYLRLTTADYAADAHTVMRWIGKPAVLLGHSMGGIVVQKAAEAMPAAALVLLAAVGPGQLGKIRDPLPVDRPFAPDKATLRTMWFREIEDGAFTRFHARLVPESPGVLNDYSGGGVPIDRAAIACPVLAIKGEFDNTPVHPAPDIAAFYGGDAMVVPGAAHNLMMESPSLPVAITDQPMAARQAGRPGASPREGKSVRRTIIAGMLLAGCAISTRLGRHPGKHRDDRGAHGSQRRQRRRGGTRIGRRRSARGGGRRQIHAGRHRQGH